MGLLNDVHAPKSMADNFDIADSQLNDILDLGRLRNTSNFITIWGAIPVTPRAIKNATIFLVLINWVPIIQNLCKLTEVVIMVLGKIHVNLKQKC